MKYVIYLISILTSLLALIVFAVSKSAIHEILSALLFIIASNGIFTASIIGAIEKGKK